MRLNKRIFTSNISSNLSIIINAHLCCYIRVIHIIRLTVVDICKHLFRCKSFLLNGEEVNHERVSGLAHQTVDNLTLVPSTARTGVRMRVNLFSLTGLTPSLTVSGEVGFNGHVRMHCLLLMPSASGTPPPLPRLLSTITSQRYTICLGLVV